MDIKVTEQASEEIIGVYPMAAAFYTAYSCGAEKGFPFPGDLDERETGRFAQARRRVCKALAEGRRIDEHDEGEDAVILMFGRAPRSRGSAEEMRQALDGASLKAQLASFYRLIGIPQQP